MSVVAHSARVVEASARVYRRTWRGSVISTFFNPILYLLAMGVGLGQLVDEGTGSASLGIEYLTFLAPGLLAATAMMTGAGDASWPVMAGIKWRKTYEAVLATPVGVPELMIGHLSWVGIRLLFVTVVYSGVMTAFGATTVVEGALAVPPAVLTGLAFSAVVTGYTARLKDEQGLSALFRFAIMPLFLFSGTFFPISQLPDWMEPLAFATPLWHGVELTRAAALGIESALPTIVHAGVLVSFAAVFSLLSVRILDGRLVK